MSFGDLEEGFQELFCVHGMIVFVLWRVYVVVFIDNDADDALSTVFLTLAAVVMVGVVAGILTSTKTYPFDFGAVQKPHESYNGINVRLRYFVRMTITRQ